MSNERQTLVSSLCDEVKSRTVEALRDMAERVDAAGLDPVKLGATYGDIVGYNPFDDEPASDPAAVRAMLRGYVIETGESERIEWDKFVPAQWQADMID